MTYRNLKAIIKALPIEEWVKTDIEMSIDDFIKETFNRWLALLETDGIDSKNMVATDIQQLLKEIKKMDEELEYDTKRLLAKYDIESLEGLEEILKEYDNIGG